MANLAPEYDGLQCRLATRNPRDAVPTQGQELYDNAEDAQPQVTRLSKRRKNAHEKEWYRIEQVEYQFSLLDDGLMRYKYRYRLRRIERINKC